MLLSRLLIYYVFRLQSTCPQELEEEKRKKAKHPEQQGVLVRLFSYKYHETKASGIARNLSLQAQHLFVSVRNKVAKVMFLHVSVILFTGGGGGCAILA